MLGLREPRRLPRPLSQPQAADLLASFRTWRDRAIAGLMLYCGLRSCEVLALTVADVYISGRRLQVMGKGNRERRVPLDGDVALVIQVYLLAERPETSSANVFIVAKGSNRGQPLTAAGLRTIFRDHRGVSGIGGGHPHALRHTFGTALAEAGVEVEQACADLIANQQPVNTPDPGQDAQHGQDGKDSQNNTSDPSNDSHNGPNQSTASPTSTDGREQGG